MYGHIFETKSEATRAKAAYQLAVRAGVSAKFADEFIQGGEIDFTMTGKRGGAFTIAQAYSSSTEGVSINWKMIRNA